MAKKNIMPEKPDPTPDRQLESKSGWCITQNHSKCPYKFSFGKCGCNCHKKKGKND